MTDVFLAQSVRDDIEDLPNDIRDRVKEGLRDAAARPDRQLKNLSNREGYSVRIGDYRAIVDWDKAEDRINVVDFGHRRNIYD
jgi:mRNA interferase RelE/StbE